MKTIILDEKSRDYFLDMDPLLIMEKSEWNGCSALGAFEEDENGFDVPCAIIIRAQYEDILAILWMYVKPELRGHGIAGELLREAAETAKELKLPWVAASFDDIPGRISVTGGSDRTYFRMQGFKEDPRFPALSPEQAEILVIAADELLEGIPRPTDPYADVLELDDGPALPPMTAAPPWYQTPPDRTIRIDEITVEGEEEPEDPALRIDSVGSCSIPEFYEMLRECFRLGHEGVFANMALRTDQIPLSWFDPDVSCFIQENGKLAGILLVGTGPKEEPVFTLFFVEGAALQQKLVFLLEYTARKLKNKYPPDTEISFYFQDKSLKRLAKVAFAR